MSIACQLLNRGTLKAIEFLYFSISYQMLIIILLSGKSITEENVIEWVEEEQAIATDETSRFGLNGINC